MDHLSCDIETFSSVDIKKSGLYAYVEAPDFQVMLFAYSLNGAPVQVVDLMAGEQIPPEIITLLFSASCIKHAYNASFEWACLTKHFGVTASTAWLSQWRCTMLHGLYCGYTAGLAATGEALGLPQDKRKLWTGSNLIRTFCVPCKPTKANGGRTRTLPHHEPDKWQLFKDYCRQDVVTEMEIEHRLAAFPVPEEEQRRWELDQQINARGVRIDQDLVYGALSLGQTVSQQLTAEAVALTGLANPKSVSQLKKWLEEETEEEIADLRKDTVSTLLSGDIGSDAAKRVLEIRQELSKTSTKKYDALQNTVCADGRVRGLLQFYGANRTGRWAGRLVQVQNLPRNYLESLNHARECTKSQKLDVLQVIYGNVPDTLSQLIRTAFIPSDGRTFLVADFSAIEARIIAWLAREQWRQEVFATHGKIYEASAAAMFGVPIETIAKGQKNYGLRQKGKIAELALGYGGSTGALINMGALKMGLEEDELPEIVSRWREANPAICRLWYDLEALALNNVRDGHTTNYRNLVTFRREIDFNTQQDFLTLELPSGRKLYYARPFLAPNRWGKDSIRYQGMDQTSKKWTEQETYGGKLTENSVQAIARDCLALAIDRLNAAGFPIVMHVHDECIIDAAPDLSLEAACEIMGQPIPWASGLLLRADGFETAYYKKE